MKLQQCMKKFRLHHEWPAAEIAPMCDRFVSEGIADSWFFIRYADDGSHLRIRLHGESAHLIETVWSISFAPGKKTRI